jgi:hypothetical protein
MLPRYDGHQAQHDGTLHPAGGSVRVHDILSPTAYPHLATLSSLGNTTALITTSDVIQAEFAIDASKIQQQQRTYAGEAIFEQLGRAQELTRQERARGYLPGPRYWKIAEFKVGDEVVRAVVPTEASTTVPATYDAVPQDAPSWTSEGMLPPASRFAFAVGAGGLVCRFGKRASIQESTELARKRGHSLDQRLTAPTGPCCVRLRVVLPPERHPQIVCFIGNATTIQVELETQGTTSRSRSKRNPMIHSPTCRNRRVDKEALQETIQPSLIIKKILFLMSPC